MSSRLTSVLTPVLVMLGILVGAPPALAQDEPAGLNVGDVKLTGRIEGHSFSFKLDMAITGARAGAVLPLVAGDVVLEEVTQPKAGGQAKYEPEKRAYSLALDVAGAQNIAATFAARASSQEGGAWREVIVQLPSARMRSIEVVCDRTDLEVQFPGALKLERKVVDDKLVITALLSPGVPFRARWKPQVQELEAKLVFATEANTIAMVSAGSMKIDTLFEFIVSQGRMSELTFAVPANLSVTQVRGQFIRDWQIKPAAEAGGRSTLTVALNRPLMGRYGLQIMSEAVLAPFPTQANVPVIEPIGGIRSGGGIMVGTNSAISLVVRETAGLSQINAAAFPRVLLAKDEQRAIPAVKSFSFTHATTPYQMTIALADIVPTFDTTQVLVVNVTEEDLTVQGRIDLEVRDAPLRDIVLSVPARFVVADVAGQMVEEFTLRPLPPEADVNAPRLVEVRFKQPVLGRTVIFYKLELGKGPLDVEQSLQGFAVRGASVKRSFIVVAADPSVAVDTPVATKMTEMNTAAVPERVPSAQYAYSYRADNWRLALTARKKPASIRVESFHLVTLSEQVAYGNIAFSFVITGSPIDEFSFRIPANLDFVDVIGRDVRSVSIDPTDNQVRRVKIARKVIGDYTLGMTFTLKYKDGDTIEVGGIQCEGPQVQTQAGYLAIASHLNLQVDPQPTPGSEIRAIEQEELPGSYQLLVNAPLLKAFTFIKPPHTQRLKVSAYDRVPLLPVVIEVTDIRTDIFAHENGATESRTTVRYRIKNSSSQFLPLSMPGQAGVKVWQTRVGMTTVENNQPVDRLERVTASMDPKNNLLMIPLPRNANPNEPITVEVEYGTEHEDLGWRGHIHLEGPTTDPRNAVNSTFTNWTVTAPAQWALNVVDANLLPQARVQNHGGLGAVMEKTVAAWGWAIKEWFGAFAGESELRMATTIALFTIAFIVLALTGIIYAATARPRALPMTVTLVVFVLLAGLGVLAASAPMLSTQELKPDDLSRLVMTQTITMNADTPVILEANLVPQWRQHASFLGGFVVPILAVLVLILTAMPTMRQRLDLTRLGLITVIICAFVALLYGLAQFQIFVPAILHIFTWIIPVGLLLCFLWRVLVRPMMHAARSQTTGPVQRITTASLIALAMLLPGATPASAQESILNIAAKEPVFDRVEATLKADGDHVEVQLNLRVTATEPARIVLMDQNPIVLTPDDPTAPVRLQVQGRRYYLVVSEAGTFDVSFKFLSALGKAQEDQSRSFTFPLPMALTNRVTMTIPAAGLDVYVDQAMRMTREEADGVTTVNALLGPGDDIAIAWKPRARETSQEKTSFYSQVVSAVRLDASLIEARHVVRFQIAQGEMRDIRIRIPEPMTVTAVQGRSMGAWRFDPARQELEVRLSEAVTGEYAMALVTQISREKLPYDAVIAPLIVLDAVRHTGIMGLIVTPAVQTTVTAAPQTMNVDDFAREADNLLRTFADYNPAAAGAIRFAYRTMTAQDSVTVQAVEVKPELRADEQATFAITDDRLIYNGTMMVDISKAGVFSVELKLPAAFEIDTLTAPQVSHWDDVVQGATRTVVVHFKEKFVGQVALRLELSQAVTGLPPLITAPRISVTGAVKHTGQIIVAADRGVRMTIAQRDGITELNTLEMGIREQGTLAFRLLKPDWLLALATEVIEPRITAQFLHVAQVSEGLVRHTHHLVYTLANAGSKVFEVQLPASAQGVVITGPDIARRDELVKGSGKYRVELNRKRYDQPYPLTVSYDTKYTLPVDAASASGAIAIEPVLALGTDQQRGHIAVLSTPRVQLTVASRSDLLQQAEPRTIPGIFGARNLAAAAFCYSTATPQYNLAITAQRHPAADLEQADVLETMIHTVVSDTGESVTKVWMDIRVGSKQHLETILPDGASVWTLLVNGRSTVPSVKKTQGAPDAVLIPLGAAAGSVPARIELVYVAPRAPDWTRARPVFIGPQFDLPLKKITWQLHVPDQFDYGNFKGTLTVNEDVVTAQQISEYGLRDYDAQVYMFNTSNYRIARDAQTAGDQLLREGDQKRAQQLYEAAVHYSAFSEDARVKLHQFNDDNALIGLVGARQRLREQAEGAARTGQPMEQVNTETIGRIKSSLSKADSENLAQLTRVWTEIQAKAAGETVQLAVNMPYRGRVLQFERSVQVRDRTPMIVEFDADPIKESSRWTTSFWALGLILLMTGLYMGMTHLSRQWSSLPAAFAQDEAMARADRAASGSSDTPARNANDDDLAEGDFAEGDEDEDDDEAEEDDDDEDDEDEDDLHPSPPDRSSP